ncbi:MAG: universal stress protein [Gemmatimonadota bacterium]
MSSTARIASYREVMVPLDGSQFAEQALPYAEAVVRRTGARLVLVRVHELPIGADGVALDPQMDEEFRERSREYLGRIADEVASRLGVAVQTRMLVGRAAAMLERAAREGEVDMVVMSTHGRGGFERVWLGSVADEVVRCLEVPVLLVRPRNDGDASRRATFDRILVALDGSVLSEQILPHASALGLPGRTQYTLVRVVPPELVVGGHVFRLDEERARELVNRAEAYLGGVASALRPRAGEVRTHAIKHAAPAVAILDAARADGSDLIAMTTHGYGGLKRLLLGSTADKVVRAADIPVMLLRPGSRG